MNLYFIIVAGGSGRRMQTTTPKQFLEVCQKPILFHTLACFHRYDATADLVLVLPSNQLSYWKTLCEKYAVSIPHRVVSGGEERFFSVKNALDTIEDENGLVAIHDGVRPLVSQETIRQALVAAEEKGAAIPVVDLKESLRYVDSLSHKSVDRSAYRLVQTPQCFKLSEIKKAYAQDFSPLFTDDASVMEQAGYGVEMTKGNEENIKLTTPSDLLIAEALLKAGS